MCLVLLGCVGTRVCLRRTSNSFPGCDSRVPCAVGMSQAIGPDTRVCLETCAAAAACPPPIDIGPDTRVCLETCAAAAQWMPTTVNVRTQEAIDVLAQWMPIGAHRCLPPAHRYRARFSRVPCAAAAHVSWACCGACLLGLLRISVALL